MSNQKITVLPPKSHKFFKAFLKALTLWKKEVRSLHPKDWERFYVFVSHCAQYNVSLSSYNVERLLKENKFSKELIDELSLIYKHGRRLLKIH